MKTKFFSIALVLVVALLLAGCSSRPQVGELQSESQSVERGDAKTVLVKINMGAGNLAVTAGTEQLLDADFNYNVAELKPSVKYSGGTLVVEQPGAEGLRLPDLQGITDFRNEWDLRLNGDVPMDLRVDMGAGDSDLQVADLSLTGLDITLGAGRSTIDLSQDWASDLDVRIDSGAADLTVRLPRDVGVRVEIDRGPTVINAPNMTQDGNVYTNDAYGTSDVTLKINMQSGIGQINLEGEE
jgi:hypothetical protein